jgi:hypothetical protein
MLVFVLVAINAIVALTSIAGVETPLDALATEQSVVPIENEGATPAGEEMSSALNGAAILSLALWVFVLYGLAQGHTWAWWLLTFSAIVMVATSLIAMVMGTAAVGIITLVVNILMLAALVHKQTIGVFRPRLSMIPEDGLWGTD